MEGNEEGIEEMKIEKSKKIKNRYKEKEKKK